MATPLPLPRDLAGRRVSGLRLWRQWLLLLGPIFLLAGLGVRGLLVSRTAAWDRAVEAAERSVRELSLEHLWASIQRGARAPVVYAVPPLPGPESRALATYEELARDPAAAEASGAWARLAEQCGEAVTRSGVPLRALVEWARLEQARVPAQMPGRLYQMLQSTVDVSPSLLTPAFLRLATERWAHEGQVRGIVTTPSWHLTPGLAWWWERWADQEDARATVRREAARLASATAPFWLEGEGGRSWWALRDGPDSASRLLSLHELREALAFFEEISATSAYSRAVLRIGNRPIGPTAVGPELVTRTWDGLTVAIVLTDADGLYAQQRQQAWWFAALLVCAVGGAVAAMVAMQRAVARERQLGALKSDFVASVSHELRTPVAAMRLMAENLVDAQVALPPERRAEYHRLIAEECARLGALIDNVLDFARIEQQRKTYDFAETDLPALVEDAVSLIAPRARQRRQTVQVKEPAGLLDFAPCCDALAVRQALLNLLDNAVKFSPPETAIQVGYGLIGESWYVSVKDAGHGVAEAEQERIFERFYRIGSELRRETQGAGIGLAIVRHIAEAHGGLVEVRSKPGHGATFTLRLPFLPSSLPAAHPGSSPLWPAS